MAFSTGGHGGLSSDINVTPMIDILLVLLIIFMAITPVTPHGLEALVPQPPKTNTPPKENDTAIVVQILRGNGNQPAYKINETDVQKADLAGKLQTIFSTRATKVMFVKGDKDLDFAPISQCDRYRQGRRRRSRGPDYTEDSSGPVTRPDLGELKPRSRCRMLQHVSDANRRHAGSVLALSRSGGGRSLRLSQPVVGFLPIST